MTSNKTTPDLEVLEQLLDTWGADRSRWPAPARARAEALLAEHPQAARMFEAAAAFDALLSRAPAPAAGRHALLVDRITASAIAAGGSDRERGKVLPWPGARRRVPALTRESWRAFAPPALLAASLALGVVLGALDLAPSAVNRLVEVVELAGDGMPAVASVDNDGLAAILDEDLL
jgi:hypothetical protein